MTAIVRGVTVRTTVSPDLPIDFNVPPDPGTARVMGFLKPTLIFDTIGGPVVVAPYGEATGIARDVTNWALFFGVGLAAWTGGAMLLGARLAR